MEMERTRKSIVDRSREPGAKKPKLIEDTSLDRALNNVIDRERPRVPFGSGLVTNSQRERERGRDVEANDAVQHPQQQQKTHLQNQELVSQYKTALAELTFNSKPIITNLTIIAGENLHVAKWIAATICANIIEVPSEQKLPSLYLLDSIVKNIGRDYIKYFAARLPEVFCKAYRQVDSLIHPGMRHLFGTWKGVFPAACLQMIEKELAFQPATNGSSSGPIAARSESLSQRPPNSIHVNPKYLEARERSLQQSSRVKGVNANSGVSVPSDDDDDDAERPNRKPVVGSARPWTDLPIKEFKHPSREASSESLHEKNSAEYEDNEYSSDLSRKSNVGYVRAGERLAEQDGRDRSWYGADRNATEATTSQRNRQESEREYSKYLASRSGATSTQFQQKGPTQGVTHSGSRVMNKNWKNSEEEEYTWGDMGSKFPRTTDDAEKTENEDHHQPPRGDLDIGSRIHGGAISDSLSLAHRGQLSFGQHMPVPSTQPWREAQLGDSRKPIGMPSRISGQPERHPSVLGGLSTNLDPSLPRKGFQTPTGFSVDSNQSVESLLNSGSSLGVLGQTRHQPKQAVSPLGQSSMLLQPPSSSSLGQRQESNEEDHIPMWPLSGPKAAYPSLLTNQTYHAQPAKSSFSTNSQNHSQPGKFQNFQPQNHQHLQNSSISTQLSQRQHHNPFSLQSLPELTTQSSGQIPKPLPQVSAIGDLPKIGHSVLNHSSNFLPDAPGQSSTSSVLANLMKSGILSNNSVSDGFMNASFQDSGMLPPHTSARPPLPYGPPPTQLATSSAPNVLDPVTTHSTRTAALPPLPPGRPPASSISGTSQSSSVAKSDSDPFQFLLSSLVANGLISPEKEQITCSAPSPQVPIQSQNQSPALSTSSFMPVTSVQSPSTIQATLSGSKLVFQDSVKGSPTCSQGSAIERMDLIGTVFKADIIRQSHPSVISGLVDDLPHQCNICGIRFKLQEPLDRHLEWHASKKADASGSRVSRGWFTNLSDLVHGNVKSPSIPTFTSSKGLVERVDRNEPAVPADENQCVCVLCAEPFEDFYSHGRDEWMFKGAVYMDIQAGSGELGTANEDSVDGPIVHKNCISPSSIYDLGLINVKQELMNG